MNFDYCEGKVHVVKEGDTLYKISKMHNVALALIMRANPYVDVYNLKVGSEICIPVMPEAPLPVIPEVSMPMMPMEPDNLVPPMTGMPQMPQMPMNQNQMNRNNQNTMTNLINNQSTNNMGRVITMPSPVPIFSDSVVSYVVRDGDNLNDILDHFDLELEDLLNFNHLSDIILKAGTTLKLPEKNDEEDD